MKDPHVLRSGTRVMNRVLVVDDHAVLRRGIQSIVRAWPGWEIAGETGSGEEAVRLSSSLKPDIILMDISMPGIGGLEATKIICKQQPEAKILLLTLHDSIEWVRIAFQAGARGFSAARAPPRPRPARSAPAARCEYRPAGACHE